MQQVTILETGLANLASVVAAFQRLGAGVSIRAVLNLQRG